MTTAELMTQATAEGLRLGLVDDQISAQGPGGASRPWGAPAPEPDPLLAFAHGPLREAWELLTLLSLDDGIAHLEHRPDGSRAIQLRQAVPDHLAVMIYDICGLSLAPLRPVALFTNSRLARPSRHDKLAEPRPRVA